MLAKNGQCSAHHGCQETVNRLQRSPHIRGAFVRPRVRRPFQVVAGTRRPRGSARVSAAASLAPSCGLGSAVLSRTPAAGEGSAQPSGQSSMLAKNGQGSALLWLPGPCHLSLLNEIFQFFICQGSRNIRQTTGSEVCEEHPPCFCVFVFSSHPPRRFLFHSVAFIIMLPLFLLVLKLQDSPLANLSTHPPSPDLVSYHLDR